MNKLKAGDKIKVMRGKAAGSTGVIEKVIGLKVLVPGINLVTRHVKPNQTLNIPGGIVKVERPIDASNVMLLDPKTGKPTRVGFKVDAKTGKKVRISKKSGTQI